MIAEEKTSIEMSQLLKVANEKYKLNYSDTDLSNLRDIITGGQHENLT